MRCRCSILSAADRIDEAGIETERNGLLQICRADLKHPFSPDRVIDFGVGPIKTETEKINHIGRDTIKKVMKEETVGVNGNMCNRIAGQHQPMDKIRMHCRFAAKKNDIGAFFPVGKKTNPGFHLLPVEHVGAVLLRIDVTVSAGEVAALSVCGGTHSALQP